MGKPLIVPIVSDWQRDVEHGLLLTCTIPVCANRAEAWKYRGAANPAIVLAVALSRRFCQLSSQLAFVTGGGGSLRGK